MLAEDRAPVPTQPSSLVEDIKQAVREALLEERGAVTVAESLGPDALIDYTSWRKANNISHELGMKLRNSGQLKVLRVGGKLMLRLGEAKNFVRRLPLA